MELDKARFIQEKYNQVDKISDKIKSLELSPISVSFSTKSYTINTLWSEDKEFIEIVRKSAVTLLRTRMELLIGEIKEIN